MTASPNVRRSRILPIDRYAGVAPQFSWNDGGYLYRRDGFGAPIPVSVEERDHFVRAGLRSLLLHVGALLLVLWAAVLAAERLHPTGSDVTRAAIVALMASVVGLILYRSHAWYADAPARALAGRPAVGPAGEVDVTRWPSYGTIATAVFATFLAILFHIRSTLVSVVGVSVAAIVVGLAVAGMKWWFERGFTPVQRQKAAERRATVRMRDHRPFRPFRMLLLIVFLLVEMAVGLVAFVMVMGGIIELSGTSWEDPAPVPFIGGMVLGFAALWLAIWPLEKLCKRLTGTTTVDEFNGLF
jgi:hypothetical protein